MNGTRALAGLAIAALALGAGPAVSERYAYQTYRERVGPVTVLVDSYPASLREDDAYFPLHVAIGLKGGAPDVTVTRETFTVIDARGNRVPAAGALELRENYGKLLFDAALMRGRPLVVGQQFNGRLELDSNFYPDAKGIGIVQDRIHMGPFTWFHDVVYFPRPPAGLGGVMTLRLEGGGLEEPIEVRFEVPRRPSKNRVS